MANHLGTDHTDFFVNAQDAVQVIPKLPQIFDEPFGDSSAIPTFLVSQLARSMVTVSLSGDGGDELFGGYSRYHRTANIWNQLSRIPRALRAPMSRGASALATQIPDRSGGFILQRAGQYLSAQSAQACYDVQFSHHHGVSTGVLDVSDALALRSRPADSLDAESDIFDFMMYEDAITYLPDDILVKVDRAGMAVSLESRIPMLDHRVVEFAWRLPLHMKVRHGEGKRILKEVLRHYLPADMVDRKKMGFGVPVGDWIRGPLREWAESLVSEHRLREQGLFDATIIRKHWTRFVKGGRVSSDSVWQLLMFQSWLDG